MEEKYERLSDVVEMSGTRIPELTATLIERTENKAIYYRWDNVYEVFRMKKSGATTMMGRSYPAREVYPGNEDFGKIAWCFRDKSMAMDMYKRIPDAPVYIGARDDNSASDDL